MALRAVFIVVAATGVGCGVNRDGLNGPFGKDAGSDRGATGDTAKDRASGPDTMTDAGGPETTPVERGTGGVTGAGGDAGLTDAPVDMIVSPPDTGKDAPPDAPADLGTGDDTRPETGPPAPDADTGDGPIDAPMSGCPTGTRLCGGLCQPTTAPGACGPLCLACTAPAHATPTCNGTSCGFACDTGYHACGATCAADSDATACGPSCTPCQAPASGRAICSGGKCDFTCDLNPGFHKCANACVTNNSTFTCGASCSPCPTPPNAVATCDGTACGATCVDGFHSCDSACVSNTSLSSCGPTSCAACPMAPNNATEICDGTACDFACDPNFARQGNGCVQGCMVCDAGATPVTLPGGRFTGTTFGPSQNTGSCGGAASPEAVYKLTLTVQSDVFVSTHGSKFDTIVYMRRGCCGTDTMACSDDADGRATSVISRSGLGAGTYYIFIDGKMGAMGDYVVDIYATPTSNNPGDACGNPTRITSTAVTGNTCNMRRDYDPPASCVFGGLGTAGSGPDSVYYFVLDTASVVTFNTCSGTCMDSVLYVRDICTQAAVGAGTNAMCNDDSCMSNTTCFPNQNAQSQLSLSLSAGAHYLMVDTHPQLPNDQTQRCGSYTVTPGGIPE